MSANSRGVGRGAQAAPHPERSPNRQVFDKLWEAGECVGPYSPDIDYFKVLREAMKEGRVEL